MTDHDPISAALGRITRAAYAATVSGRAHAVVDYSGFNQEIRVYAFAADASWAVGCPDRQYDSGLVELARSHPYAVMTRLEALLAEIEQLDLRTPAAQATA